MLGYSHSKLIPILSAAAMASALSGCFQNISDSDGVASKKSTSQSNFTDSGGGTVSGAFNGATILASTALSGIVGSYASPSNASKLGVLINLKAPLMAAIGEDTLNSLLNRVDAESAVQNIDVTLLVPQFGFKLNFKFAKIAYGNNKQLRNALSVRPDLAGVDLGTGYLPDSAPVLQQPSGYVFTYGGMSLGAAIARLTILYTDSLTGAAGFLPNTSNSTWGVGFPDNSSPQANASFTPLTPNLGKIFDKLYRNPNDGSWTADADFADVGVNASKYMLAIHKKADGSVAQAWIINPIVAAPKGVLLCSSQRDDLEYRIADPASPANNPTYYYVGDKAACNCHPTETEAGVATPIAGVFDPCVTPPSPGALSTRANSATNKATFLTEASAMYPPSPASAVFAPKLTTVNGFTITSPL